MLEKIISGGQTGVDQAALFSASQNGFDVGGWCPKGGLDENGRCISGQYGLRQTETADPDERTKRNIDDSDGTLIVVPVWPLPTYIQDGTRLTYAYTEAQGKPYLIIALSDSNDDNIDTIRQWLVSHKICILNIGGPRESSSPGIYKDSSAFFNALFMQLGLKPRI